MSGAGTTVEGPETGAELLPASPATVTILLGLYRGAEHLGEQLDSFAAQTHADWRLIVSDDGPDDGGAGLVREFAQGGGRRPGQVRLVRGPQAGFARNYLSMLTALADAGPPGMVAFSDQDDIWLPERLERGVEALRGVSGPALYCSRTLIFFTGAPGRRRLSPPRPRPPGFGNALVQNIAAGNTILLNAEAAAILCAAARRTETVVAHDWWAYLLVTGAGGRVLHDDRPSVLYRQHDGNSIGANDSWRAKLKRLGMLLDGTMAEWTDSNLAALEQADAWLEPDARGKVAALRRLRDLPGPLARLRAFAGLGLYRQTLASTIALWVAVLIRRL